MHSLIDYKAKCALTGLQFQFFSNDEILKLSVKEITNSQSLDRLLNPVPNGLYDLALGPLDKNDVCMTCGLDYLTCPGHLGHIQLVLPVFNPVLFKDLVKLLRSSCPTCNRLLTTKLEKDYFCSLMRLINNGLTNKIQVIHDLYTTIVNTNDPNLIGTLSFRGQFDEALARILSEPAIDLDNDTCVRNIINEKFDILRQFYDIKLKQNRKQCPNCSMPLRDLRAEHNSKLFYAKGVSKRQLRKTQFSKKVPIAQDENEEDPDLDLDNDLNVNIEKLALTDDEKLETLSGQTYLTPVDARRLIESLLKNEKELLNYIFGITHETQDRDLLSSFFFNNIVVPPSKFRPVSQYKEQKFENAQTIQLSKLIQENVVLREILNEIREDVSKLTEVTKVKEGGSAASNARIQEKLQNSWIHLQTIVNTLYDSDMDKINTDTPNGLKQVLERKEGLFRKHMMGKRVNYAGRSVISPDVYIGTDEIGVPEVFAKKLTYPQPVNSINFYEMRQLVLNGPDVYPGATYVQHGNGAMIKLKGKDYESRLAIAKQLLTPESSIDPHLDIKIVHRHLKNGDILLFNRQPTLHRNSVMAHKARVLPHEKTLRMHYSNCKAYNADFDGDEMNIHLPQNEIARAEAYNLIAASEHYLVPKDGTPLGGLIHDHIVGGVALTIRGRYFNRSEYQYLVYNTFGNVRGKMKFLPPAILKPCRLWTGKQVISTLLLNLLPANKNCLNLDGKAKVTEKTWFRVNEPRKPNWSSKHKFKVESADIDCMSESSVIIRNGQLMCGVLDKAHYGSSSYSLVHCCYELYGGMTASRLLTAFGKLFTTFLQQRGFTLGVEDILLTSETSRPMMKQFKKTKKIGQDALAHVFNLEGDDSDNVDKLKEEYQKAYLNPDDSIMKEIDLAYKGKVDSIQNGVVNLCFPNGLLKKFPYNNLQLMIQSGAKGSTVNSMQMSCLLGQQELEGRRPRLMPNGNTLPSFQPYDTSPNSGGFICSSFMSGLTPQEYFFHCMAGREGLVDTAVKTSRSGYLQRCLVKHLEGICVNYDLTVRDSDGSVVQFQYGEDSLSIEKTQFLNEKQFPFLIDNYKIITANAEELSKIKKMCKNESVDKKLRKYMEWREQSVCEQQAAEKNVSPFIEFSRKLWRSESVQAMPYNERIKHITQSWVNLDEDERRDFNKKYKTKARLPLTSEYNPDRYLGVVTDRLQDVMDNYINKNKFKFKSTTDSKTAVEHHNQFSLDVSQFKELIYLKSLKSCITPGDCVGVVAAQSIGEPSTQMTLNTFHFAGRGDMNVTLGIPRLREILMVASSNIKTPSMEVPIFKHREQDIDKLKSIFTRTLLWDCINEIQIVQTLKIDSYDTKERVWQTRIKFKFLSEAELKLKLHNNKTLRLYEILNYMELKFFKQLCISINKKYNQISSSSLLHASTVRDKSLKNFKNINGGDGGGGDDENELERDDMDNARESGESSGEKLLERVNDELEYVGEDEEKNAIGDENENDSDMELDGTTADVNMKEDGDEDEVENGDEEDAPVAVSLDKYKKKTKKIDETRINNVLGISKMIESYYYDAESREWCELTLKLDALKPRLDLYSLIQNEAKRCYIAKVENIKRCFISESTLPEDKGCFKMVTEGINIPAVIKHCDTLDISKIYLNDIHKMAATFGIEAATNVIKNEMKRVFNAYGINVDYRHLSLIADYMTFEGVYKPFNRLGIKSNASPLQKMSFETCLGFFKDAYLSGQKEKIKSPSACLVTGRMVHVGTGAFELVTKLV